MMALILFEALEIITCLFDWHRTVALAEFIPNVEAANLLPLAYTSTRYCPSSVLQLYWHRNLLAWVPVPSVRTICNLEFTRSKFLVNKEFVSFYNYIRVAISPRVLDYLC